MLNAAISIERNSILKLFLVAGSVVSLKLYKVAIYFINFQGSKIVLKTARNYRYKLG